MKSIGERIRLRRGELNITQQYIAERMGIDKSTVQRYECGKIRRIKYPMIICLAGILKTTPEWLAGEDEKNILPKNHKNNRKDI
ncbi:MAG: helix-turn-helix transcriptional regulator [Oscillospiraceae bacterium]|nr:helix-turn-helix transcriptional regulator [Oscillospiraceae bacterium]